VDMLSWFKRTTGTSEKAPARKRAERLETAVVSCALGPIVDVSRSGMSVRVQRATGITEGAELAIELEAPTDAMEVRVRVVRVEPLGGGRYEIAMEFVGMTDEDCVAVENLARHGKRRAAGIFVSEERRERLIEALKMPDYYQALAVEPGATEAEIHRAYRELARKYHPDVCREDGAQERFCLINEAHDALGDAEKRAGYDALYVMRWAA
jgi:hypothetical protein